MKLIIFLLLVAAYLLSGRSGESKAPGLLPFFAVGAIWDDWWDWLLQRGSELLAWLDERTGGLISWFQSLAATARAFLRDLSDSFLVAIDGITRQAGYWWDNLKKTVETWIDNAISGFRAWLEDLDQAVADFLDLDEEALSTWLEARLGEFVDNLAGWGGAFAEWLLSKGRELLSYLVNLGKTIGDWLYDKTQQWMSWLNDRALDFELWLASLDWSLDALLEMVSDYIDGKLEELVETVLGLIMFPGKWAWDGFFGWIDTVQARGELLMSQPFQVSLEANLEEFETMLPQLEETWDLIEGEMEEESATD